DKGSASSIYLSDRYKLNAPINRRFRVGGIPQLFLAQSYSLHPIGRYAECGHQSLANGVCTPLTKLKIIRAFSGGIGVPDHQHLVTEQIWMMQRVGDAADGPVRFRPDHRGIEIESDLNRKLRQSIELLRNWFAMKRVFRLVVLNSLQRLLPQRDR